jgi:cell division septum initiation protein DivIVA
VHPNGPHRENVETLRERLAHQEHQWRSVTPRRAATARAERRADPASGELREEVLRLTQERDRLRNEVEEMRRTRDELATAVDQLRGDVEESAVPNGPPSVESGRVPLGFDLDPDDDDLADAFQRVFDSELEHDKSRRWILSDLEQGSA